MNAEPQIKKKKKFSRSNRSSNRSSKNTCTVKSTFTPSKRAKRARTSESEYTYNDNNSNNSTCNNNKNNREKAAITTTISATTATTATTADATAAATPPPTAPNSANTNANINTNKVSSSFFEYGNCTNVSTRYKKQCRIGQGTYGIVYRAIDTVTNQIVALKRCLPHHEDTDGFPITTLREIQLLKEISASRGRGNDSGNGSGNGNGNGSNCGHENIIQLKEVAVSSKQSGIFLVFDYAHFDLAQFIDEHYTNHKRSPFTVPEVKCLSRQLFNALRFLHDDKCIIHRDLKLSNLLYDKERGLLKLCDFGLARRMSKLTTNNNNSTNNNNNNDNNDNNNNNNNKIIPTSPPTPPSEHLTPKVVSLWYRPPELLLNSPHYNFSVDIWAAGCVIAELILGTPLLNGNSEMNQLEKIVELLGEPNLNNWPGLADMPLFRDSNGDGNGNGNGNGSCDLPFSFGKRSSTSTSTKNANAKSLSKFLDTFSNLSTGGIVLLSNLLKYDPSQRISAADAHECKWLTSENPLPTQREYMPKFSWKK